MKRTILATVVVTVLIMSCGLVAADDWVDLKSSCSLFAMDANTGAVLGIDASGKTATLYPRDYIDGKNRTVVGPVDIPTAARDVLFKRYGSRRYFVISFDKNSQLWVLDATTLKLVSKIVVKAPVTGTIATGSDPGDPYFYLGQASYDGGACLSLKTMAWVGRTRIRGSDIAMSRDGSYLYARMTNVSPTGFNAHRRVVDATTGKPTWVKVFDERTSAGRYVPGPFNRLCAAGKAIYSANLRRKVTELDFIPQCFFRTAPVIVGLAGRRLVAASYNTFKTVSNNELPTGFLPPQDRRRRPPRSRGRSYKSPVTILPDEAGKRVILAAGQRILVRTLEDLKAPDEPLLVCVVKGPRDLLVGRKATFALTKLDKRCKIELKQHPAGMVLSANRLTWTPTPKQVGAYKAVLQLSAGKLKVEQTIDWNVTTSYVSLPFEAAGLAVNPDASRAVVWTGTDERHRGFGNEGPKPSKIALIDLQKMKLLVQRTLPYPIAVAAVDANLVYVAPAASDRINALAQKDLSRKNYVVTDSAVEKLLPVSSTRLIAHTQQHGPRIYDVPKLKLFPLFPRQNKQSKWGPFAPVMNYRGQRPGSTPVRMGRKWYAAGCVFGPGLRTASMFVNVDGMPVLAQRRQRQIAPVPPLLWNRVYDGQRLRTRAGQNVTEFGRDPTVILSQVPVAASVTISINQKRRGFNYQRPTRSAVMTLRELVAGEVVERVPLMANVPVDRGRTRDPACIVAGDARKVVAVVGNRLFVHRISDKTLALLPRPFDFEPLDKITMIDMTKPTVVKIRTTGGADPIEFELLGTQKGIEIDTKTGAVTIDGPSLVEPATVTALALVQSQPWADPSGRARPMRQTPKQVVATIIRTAATRFKTYTGKAPKGVPVLVTIRVAATDKHQHVASLGFQAVIDIPQSALLRNIEAALAETKKRQKKIEEERAESRRRWEEREKARALAAQARNRATSRPADSEALQKLQRRIERLEAQVDLLMKLLQGRANDK